MHAKHTIGLLLAAFLQGATSTVEQVAVDGTGGMKRGLDNGGVNLYGIQNAVSITWDEEGHVFVAEKTGVIKSINGWIGQPTNVVLDITPQVFWYGDHGLTSIEYYRGFIYATYMMKNPAIGDTCADYGQMDGRPLEEVYGCESWGRLSRWPMANGQIAGPEQVLVDGSLMNEQGFRRQCVQFSTHGAACVIVGGDGNIYATFGDGASFTVPDIGQCGGDPCGGPAGLKGGYRSQDPNRLNGKIVRINPDTMALNVVSTGHRNPWRLTWHNGQLLESETGWYTAEEINVIQDGKNYGWPCYEGNDKAPEYINFWNTEQVCQQLEASGTHQGPAFAFYHPQPPPPGNVMSITCVGSYNGRIYFGDYTQGWLHSIDENFQDEQEVLRNVHPVELKVTPAGFAYVDFLNGVVKSVDVGGPLASPSPTPAAPFASITATVTSWEPNSGNTVDFTCDNNLDVGREGAKYTWTAELLTDCSKSDCSPVAQDIPVGTTKVLRLASPTSSGTLRVVCEATTYAGLTKSSAPFFLASGEAQLCTCGSGGSVSSSNSGFNAGSPGFIGGVAAAAAVVVAGAAMATWYYLRRQPGDGDAGVSRRPAAAAATSGAKPIPHLTAAASAQGNHTNGAAGATSSSSILSRRPGAPDVPPIGDGTTSTAQAPVKPSPANAGPVQHTPQGERKV